MITIYRRAEVIARCERAEVLTGLRSGRFELTDHYESPETDGWISLPHFESRAYERPTSTENPTEHRFFCSYGDTIEPDPSHRPIQDLKQLGELIRLSERRPPSQPAAPRPDPTPKPFIELLALLTAPFRLLSQLVDWTVDTLFDLVGKIALILIPVFLVIGIIIAFVYAWEEMRARAGGVHISTQAPGASSAKDPVDRLAQAKKMFEAGLLSDAEYEAIKAKIITEL